MTDRLLWEKAPVGIAKRAKEKKYCMVLVFAGSIEPQGVRKVQDEMQLVDGAFPILPGVMTLEESHAEDSGI